jgi:molecular chaperone IbpA
MKTYDFIPLWKATLGFGLFDLINNSQLLEGQDSYPPYDIAWIGEESYRISLALAGGRREHHHNTAESFDRYRAPPGRHPKGPNQEFIYQGNSARPFERRLSLADHVEVEHVAFANGRLQIDLVRKVPHAIKPRRIEITTDGQTNSPRNTKPNTTMKVVGA